ncbi:MAG TPA: type II toxin-antitoxin system VapC family toxin [Polyangiaceae bacterium]|nr:type II toxin-antitoxin system VapC family toxin [Polyangiaceae bacterium]
MIVYFDTSALVKRYIHESDSNTVIEHWRNAQLAVSSQLLYAEMIATFARKRREQPTSAMLIDSAEQTFRNDWQTLHRILLDDIVNQWVDRLLVRHSLRGADAVHLGSALRLRDIVQTEVVFACADRELVKAANAEGLATVP